MALPSDGSPYDEKLNFLRAFQKELAPLDIHSVGTMITLLHLYIHTKATMSALAIACHVSTAAITGQIDKLDKVGLVRRERYEGDRRTIYAILTTTGLEVMKRVLPQEQNAAATPIPTSPPIDESL